MSDVIMVYATASDYHAAYGGVFGGLEPVELTTLDEPTALLPDNGRIDYWLASASAFIRSQLGLPDNSTVNLMVFKEWCIDVCRYKMDSYNAREDVRKRYEDAVTAMQTMRKDGVLEEIIEGIGGNKRPIMTGFVA